MAGSVFRPIDAAFASPKPKEATNPLTQFGNPSSFTAAATQQAADYDKIMGMYGDLYKKNAANPMIASPVTPQTTPYSRSGEVGESLSNLSDLSQTGGYDAQGIEDLRARGISPIRSIYANAQRELDRAKSLSGGYSPNYAATSAKMARDESNQIGQATQDVNAGIAQNVAANKISIAPQFASASERENEAKTGVAKSNDDIVNQINQFNAQLKLDAQKTNTGTQGDVLAGMRSLYGTTPALTSTFGTQVGQAANIGQNQQQLDEAKRKDNFSLIRNFG